MKTATINTLIEASQILKKSNWTYEYCHGETVTEKHIEKHISEIEDGLQKSTLEDLLHKIAIELDRNPPDEELTNANDIANYVAHDIALFYVQDYIYETVTFKLH